MNDYRLMDLAIARARAQLRKGNRPIYCVIVDAKGRIIGEAGNTVSRDGDPTAHAEVNAIRDACARLRSTSLSGCALYTPMEPCPMCFAAILEAGIARVVAGAKHRSAVGRRDLGNYSMKAFLALVSRELPVRHVREAECEKLRRSWLERLTTATRRRVRRRQ